MNLCRLRTFRSATSSAALAGASQTGKMVASLAGLRIDLSRPAIPLTPPPP